MEYLSTTSFLYVLIWFVESLSLLVTYTLYFWRFETYHADAHSTSRFGKRARVAATSTLNINLSTSNLNMFLESVISWRRLREFEHKAIEINEVKTYLLFFHNMSAVVCFSNNV